LQALFVPKSAIDLSPSVYQEGVVVGIWRWVPK